MVAINPINRRGAKLSIHQDAMKNSQPDKIEA